MLTCVNQLCVQSAALYSQDMCTVRRLTLHYTIHISPVNFCLIWQPHHTVTVVLSILIRLISKKCSSLALFLCFLQKNCSKLSFKFKWSGYFLCQKNVRSVKFLIHCKKNSFISQKR